MKEKLLLVGAGGFGRVVLEHIQSQYDCAFVDDGKELGTSVNGCKVVGKIDNIDILFKEYRKLIVAIGNNKLRERVYTTAEQIGYEFPNIILPSVYISPYASFGKGCVFLNNVVIQNNAKIGSGVILNPGVEIHHDSTIGNNVLIYTNSVVRSLAAVGDRAHIGSTLTIGTGVYIKEDSVIEDGKTIL